MDDQRILDLFFDRNEEAIEETAGKYGGYCYSIAFHVLQEHEDSEECVNDTWMRAWDAIPPNRPNLLSVFLGKITRNLSLDRLRRKNASKRGSGALQVQLDELAEVIADQHSIDDKISAKELTESLNHFLHTLTEEKQRMFLQRYWYMNSIQEIAEDSGKGISAVKTALLRMRQDLREWLEKDGFIV